MAFLDAFAEAAETTRGWKLDYIKHDYGYQFVCVRYTGRKFAGTGLTASAFALITSPNQYRDCEGAGSATDMCANPTRRGGTRPTQSQFDLRHSQFANPPQRVNLTIRADEWPTHVCFDQYVERLLAPLLKKAHKNSLPKLKLVANRGHQSQIFGAAAPSR